MAALSGIDALVIARMPFVENKEHHGKGERHGCGRPMRLMATVRRESTRVVVDDVLDETTVANFSKHTAYLTQSFVIRSEHDVGNGATRKDRC